jgi:endonuclease VIII
MPEGDTIHRAAARLRPALEGRTVTRFEAPRVVGRTPRIGSTVTNVEARGKHLLIDFSDGLRLHTHMRMTGSWHIYRTGERWRKAPWMARAVIGVDSGWEAVCFNAPVVEVHDQRDRTPKPGLDTLGPDLCLPGVDLDAAVERMASLTDGSEEIANVLLDQRVAAGIGNIYKSETLFACGVEPFTPVGELDVPTRRRLLATASKLLRANLGAGQRTTVASAGEHGGLGVYGRSGRPCRRCGTPIKLARQGEGQRVTYWCPRCQPR